MRNGEPWFVAKDVCEILELGNPSMSCASLDEDEKAAININDTSSNGITQARELLVISESGLYSLIFRSRKPEAKAFSRWVRKEVLPAIRKTGAYGIAANSGKNGTLACKYLPFALICNLEKIWKVRYKRSTYTRFAQKIGRCANISLLEQYNQECPPWNT